MLWSSMGTYAWGPQPTCGKDTEYDPAAALTNATVMPQSLISLMSLSKAFPVKFL